MQGVACPESPASSLSGSSQYRHFSPAGNGLHISAMSCPSSSKQTNDHHGWPNHPKLARRTSIGIPTNGAPVSAVMVLILRRPRRSRREAVQEHALVLHHARTSIGPSRVVATLGVRPGRCRAGCRYALPARPGITAAAWARLLLADAKVARKALSGFMDAHDPPSPLMRVSRYGRPFAAMNSRSRSGMVFLPSRTDWGSSPSAIMVIVSNRFQTAWVASSIAFLIPSSYEASAAAVSSPSRASSSGVLRNSCRNSLPAFTSPRRSFAASRAERVASRSAASVSISRSRSATVPVLTQFDDLGDDVAVTPASERGPLPLVVPAAHGIRRVVVEDAAA